MARVAEQTVADRLQYLRRQELTLFHAYNRHAGAEVKLEQLNKLIKVITQIQTLEDIQKY